MNLSRPDPVSEWVEEVSRHLPTLSRPQVCILAWWSYATVMCQTSGISTVCTFLATLFDQSESNLRQRLREWTYEAKAKRGEKRQEIVVESYFALLLRWILAKWDPKDKQMAFAIDASTLGQRFTVLSLSVVYGGCAIPIGWVMTVANQPGAWKPLWIALLLRYQHIVPAEWKVVVFADRGLYAKWMYQTIQKVGWHPCLRINQQGLYHPHEGGVSRPLSAAAPRVGTAWCGRAVCFTEHRQLACTLLAVWEEGYKEPWLLVTDLAPEAAQAAWYRMRSWIECGFKDLKRGGWQWHHTKMLDPQRASRKWVIFAVASIWVISVGQDAESQASSPSSQERPRTLSLFRRGFVVLLALSLRGSSLPFPSLLALPWPSFPSSASVPLSSRSRQKTYP
jgi:hypothetical protein